MISKTASKLGIDLFSLQMKWAMWFLPIIFILYLGVLWFLPDADVNEMSFLSFAFEPAKIFMLVCGIISVFAFLSYYVRQGITRKDYFKGTGIAAVGMAIVMMIIIAIVAAILFFIGSYVNFLSDINTSTFLNTQSDWFIPVIAFSLILTSYYVAGWLIGVGFYRYGGWGGMGFIAIALVFTTLTDVLWEAEASHPWASWLNLNMSQLAIPISFIGALIFISIGLWIIRATTKRIPIKVE
ncbi:hypothetical protein ACM26V_17390 [Salipaludibacillus sp. HK11]|uniref:hypothetical protein n=1 Tax=Salipaludibacillus sp. HK11 TaxID=3394320 RepID=UPI0039FD49C1